MNGKIHMLNVGDADAIIVQLEQPPDKLNLLIDGGENRDHSKKIISYFKSLNITPDIIICTHLDKDHIGGLRDVLKEYHKDIKSIWVHRLANHCKSFEIALGAMEVDKIAFPRNERNDYVIASVDDLKNLVQEAEGYGLQILEPFFDSTDPGIVDRCKKWGIKILGPSKEFYDFLASKILANYVMAKIKNDTPENESSLIFKISNNGKDYLFTGDAGLQAFGDVVRKLTPVHWLKIPHHGSKKNLNLNLIEKLSPQKCFISAAGRNGHPDKDLVACLEKNNAKVECTGEKNSDLTEEI
jgi:beta-lactamase superfamily II metal-dependent hydrolase